MKNTIRFVLAAGCLAAFVAGYTLRAADRAENTAPQGSIRLKGNVAAADRPALAKIDFQRATAAALTAVPGSVIKAELGVEDGNLVYSFEVVGSDKTVTEVEIDAGNGKVLATAKASDEKEKAEVKKEKKKDKGDDEDAPKSAKKKERREKKGKNED